MISSLQGTGVAPSAQDSGSSNVSVTLTPQLYDLLQEAMKEAGIDPNQLNTPSQDAASESAAISNFQKLFGGISYPLTPTDTAASDVADTATPAFAPKYNSAKCLDSSTGAVYTMNSNYFADQNTAQWIANKYGTGEIRQTDMLGQGPFAVDTKMYEIKMQDGSWVNAGLLSSYYDRNPESQFPGLADKLIQDVLKNG